MTFFHLPFFFLSLTLIYTLEFCSVIFQKLQKVKINTFSAEQIHLLFIFSLQFFATFTELPCTISASEWQPLPWSETTAVPHRDVLLRQVSLVEWRQWCALKLSARWVRKCALCRSLVKLSHLYAQLSRLGCSSAADTGRLRRGRVQLQGQALKFGKYLCCWLCMSRIHFREKDMKLLAKGSGTIC